MSRKILSGLLLILIVIMLDNQAIAADTNSTGILNQDTVVYDNNNTRITTLPKGMVIQYVEHNSSSHRVSVYVNGAYRNGYLSVNNVEKPFESRETFEGRTISDPTIVYARNGSVLTTLNNRMIIKYTSYSESWYQANVYVNGRYQTGFIHKDSVEHKLKENISHEGITTLSTPVYSRSGALLTNLPNRTVISYTHYSTNWYRLTVYANGRYQEGYVHRSYIEDAYTEKKSYEGAIVGADTPVYARNGVRISTLPNHSIIYFSDFSPNYYKVNVYTNGGYKEGYISRIYVEKKLDEPRSLEGITIKNPTNFYSKNGRVITSLKNDYVINFKEYTNSFYSAYVYDSKSGKYRDAYLHAGDVEVAINNPTTMKAETLANPTYFYSKSGNRLSSIPSNRIINIQEFSSSYYTAYVWTPDGYRWTYLKHSDVKLLEDVNITTTAYNINFENAVNIWASVKPQKSGRNGGFVDATIEDVRYYADPRNFSNINQNGYYQYLRLDKPAGLSANQMNNTILNNKGTLAGQGQAFVDASRLYNINEIYLVSHAILETGHGTSQLAQGVVVNGVTVYNMFGIGAYDNCAVQCGAEYAYEAGWTSPYLAIVGGARFITGNYFDRGQNTLYKMRWNPQNPGTYQYATDVAWAIKQTNNIVGLYQQLDNYILHFDVPSFNYSEIEKTYGTVVNVTTTLNLRESPVDGRVITGIPNETVLEILGENTVNNDKWYQVKYSSYVGWVHSDFVSLN